MDTELQERVDTLETLVQDLQKKPAQPFAPRNDNAELSLPISVSTKRAINSVISYPVTVRLQDTSAATAANYGTFFTADKTYAVSAVTEVHGTLGTDAGAVTVQIEKLTGTQAPDSGTVLLSTALNLKSTINTVQYGTIVASGANILLRGDRLCLKDAGTLTAVANVQVTLYLEIL